MKQNLSIDIYKFLEKETTQAFLKATRNFISLIEDENIEVEKFYKKIHSSLLDIYAAGYKLEQIDLKYTNDNTKYNDDDLFDNKNVCKISELGENAFYVNVIDPTAYFEEIRKQKSKWKNFVCKLFRIETYDFEAHQGWLVYDFADIYRDLKIEITKIDTINTDEAIEDALWQLKWSFTHHWGDHCISALKALHDIWYDGKDVV